MLQVARRWWWLLVLLPLIAGSTAYALSDRQTPLYSATVMIRINPPASSALDINAVRLTQDLTETYRQLIVTRPVLDEVIETLGVSMDVEDLLRNTSASAISATQLVQISVSDSDPDQAALIANTIASTFASQVADNTLSQIQSTRGSVDEQIATIEPQVTALNSQIVELDNVDNSNNAAIQAELEDLRNQRARFQQQIADLEVQGEAVSVGVASAQTQVTVSAPAVAPDEPYAPNIVLLTALGVVAGFILAIGMLVVLQVSDNSVSDQADVQEHSGAAMLAGIETIDISRPGANPVYAVSNPHSPSAEAIRLLRTNLEFATAGKRFSTLTVTSAASAEGKSTVSANLAVVLAQAGLATVLIDADLRRPSQHIIFGIPNDDGLTRLLTQPDKDWRTTGRRVAVPNLTLIPSGPLPPNPSDLLSIDRFGELLWEIAQDVDMVIIDSPPILAVSDPLVIARQTDAALLIVHTGHSRKDALRQSAEALRQGNIRLIGVVLNRQKAKRRSGYYYAEEQPTRRPGFFSRRGRRDAVAEPRIVYLDQPGAQVVDLRPPVPRRARESAPGDNVQSFPSRRTDSIG